MFVDSLGRLTVIGGRGCSGSVSDGAINYYANNDGWFDDTSDGPVTAVLKFSDGSKREADAAWVIVGPPRFAPAIRPVVTMYDAIFDVAVRHHRHRPDIYDSNRREFDDCYEPSFRKEIYPILRAAELAHFALDKAERISLGAHHRWKYDELAGSKASTSRYARAAIVARLRRVEDWRNPNTRLQMPRLGGDDGRHGSSFLTLTRTQYHLMQQWARGRFRDDWDSKSPPDRPVTDKDLEHKITCTGLDRAALENCIGGGFYPGIEAGWILRDPRIYLHDDPLRINVLDNGQENDPIGLTPGGATMRSAVPWQADFHDCDYDWWPSHRPTDVMIVPPAGPQLEKWARGVADRADMVQKWFRLGFLLSDGKDGFVERERTL